MPRKPKKPCKYPGCPELTEGRYCKKHQREMDFNIDFTDFNPVEIDELFNNLHNKDVEDDDFDIDKALEDETISKPGDLWLLGRYKLICGDSTKEKTYEKLMDGKMANLVVTDPPYGVSYEGTAGTIQNDSLQNQNFTQR